MTELWIHGGSDENPRIPLVPTLGLREMDGGNTDAPPRGKTYMSQPATYREKTIQDIKEGSFTPRDGEPILFEKNEQGDSLIVGATAASLLEHIFLQTDPNDRSSGYSWQETIDIIVLMHSYIMDSKTLLRKVMRYFETGSKTSKPNVASSAEELKHGARVIQVRIINFLKQWFKTDVDWASDVGLRASFEQEMQRLEKKCGLDGEAWAKMLRAAFPPLVLASASSALNSTAPSAHKIALADVNSISPLELAQQLTLIDFDYFVKINFAKELLNRSFSKVDASPNVQRWTAHFNAITRWVASTILQQQDKKQRAAILGRFIKVARHLKDFNNFNGLMQVLSGISQVCISRLKETWKLLAQKEVTSYEELLQLMTPDNNYAGFRKAFQSAALPTIPFQMIILKDLTFFEEMPDRLTNSKHDMINFTKIVQIGHMLLVLTQAKSVIYEFPRIGIVQEYFQYNLNDKMLPTEEMLYKMSTVFEPPALARQISSGQSSSNDKSSFFSLKKKYKEKEKEREKEKDSLSKETKDEKKAREKELRKSMECKEKDLIAINNQFKNQFKEGMRPHSLNLKGNRELDSLQFNIRSFGGTKNDAIASPKIVVAPPSIGLEEETAMLKELTTMKRTLTTVDLIVAKEINNKESKQKAVQGVSECLQAIDRMIYLLQASFSSDDDDTERISEAFVSEERSSVVLNRRRSPSNPTPPSGLGLKGAPLFSDAFKSPLAHASPPTYTPPPPPSSSQQPQQPQQPQQLQQPQYQPDNHHPHHSHPHPHPHPQRIPPSQPPPNSVFLTSPPRTPPPNHPPSQPPPSHPPPPPPHRFLPPK